MLGRNITNLEVLKTNKVAFNRMLPGLLHEHEGKFAVFSDERVLLLADSYVGAYGEALDRLGVDSTFFIAPVREPAPPVTGSVSWDAGVMFV